MVKLMKVAALVAQLILSLHGEGHPLHEHKHEDRKTLAPIGA
jgi:hypothetical protein